MIYKVRLNKKYTFRQMKPGEMFVLDEDDVRDAQKIAYYYRKVCKRPISVTVIKRHDGHYCKRVS